MIEKNYFSNWKLQLQVNDKFFLNFLTINLDTGKKIIRNESLRNVNK